MSEGQQICQHISEFVIIMQMNRGKVDQRSERQVCVNPGVVNQ